MVRLFVSVAVIAGALALASSGRAGNADVLRAEAICDAERICSFDVTIRHADIGWKHYADRFDVLAPDGTLLGTRELQHPHVHEQPFTRRLTGVSIPPGIGQVTIRAHDSQHRYGGQTITVKLAWDPAAAKRDADDAN